MYFNRKNTEQKNWRMIKKGKHFLFGCSLVLAIGGTFVAPSVKADTVEPQPESSTTNEEEKPTSKEESSTYVAPAVTVASTTVAETNTAPATDEKTKEESEATVEKTKESDAIQAPSLTMVADPAALTEEEKANVAEAVKGVNPTATDVQVQSDGTVVVTFADGSSATLTPSQTIKAGSQVVKPRRARAVTETTSATRATEGSQNLDYSNRDNPEGYIKMNYEVDDAQNTIHWSVVVNGGRIGNQTSGYSYFTVPKDSVGAPTNWRVLQTDKYGNTMSDRRYWKNNDGIYTMGGAGRMNLYTGSEMTKELTRLYEKIGNPAIKGNEAAAAQQASERSQALYRLTADVAGGIAKNPSWTITFDTPIVDKSKTLDYTAGLQGTGAGKKTNIMTGYADNFIDNSSSKFQAVAVKEKYTAKVGGSFDATPANYVTNKPGTPEFPNNYRGATTFAWKDGQAPTATTPGTYTKTVVVTYPAHYNQAPQEVTVTFEVEGETPKPVAPAGQAPEITSNLDGKASTPADVTVNATAGSTVKLYNKDGVVIGEAVANDQGVATITPTNSLPAGEITATTTPAGGTESAKSAPITVTKTPTPYTDPGETNAPYYKLGVGTNTTQVSVYRGDNLLLLGGGASSSLRWFGVTPETIGNVKGVKYTEFLRTRTNAQGKLEGPVAWDQPLGETKVVFGATGSENATSRKLLSVYRPITVTVLETTKKYDPVAGTKVDVADSNNLSVDDKNKVIAAVKAANANSKLPLPADSQYSVDEKGNLTITYPDGSTDKIAAAYLVNPTKDTTAPDKPVVNTDLTGKAGTKTPVEVTAEKGSTVALYDKDNNKIGEATAGENGKATITPTVDIPAGAVTAKATDAAGNTSVASDPATATPAADTEAPAKPVVNTDLTGKAGTKTPVEVTAEKGSTVALYDKDNNKIGEATAGENGKATITPTVNIPAGAVTAKATDAAGNTSVASDPATATAPAATVVAPTVEIPYSNKDIKEVYVYAGEENSFDIKFKDDSGKIVSATVKQGGNREFSSVAGEADTINTQYGFKANVISSETPATADSPAVITYRGTPAATDGLSQDRLDAATKGENPAGLPLGWRYATATDADGALIENKATGSSSATDPGAFRVVLKAQNQKYDIATPAPAEKVTVADPANVTEDDLAKIKEKLQLEYSKTNDDANLADKKGTTADKANKIQSVTKDDNGNLVVTYTDGSQDKKPLSEFVTTDTEAPAKPVVNTDLTGKAGTKTPVEVSAEPGSTVALYDKDGNKIGEATAGENGRATITPTVDIPAGAVTAKATDAAGNTSDASEPTTATAAVVAPTVEIPYSNKDNKEVYVYAGEENSFDIKFKDDSGKIVSATVKQGGNRAFSPVAGEENTINTQYGFKANVISTETPATAETPAVITYRGTPAATDGLSQDRLDAATKGENPEGMVLGWRYATATDADGALIENKATGSSSATDPGAFRVVLKAQNQKYDIATPSEKVTVADPANVTEAELAKIKEKVQLEYSQNNDDANLADKKGTTADKTNKIQSVTKDADGNLVVTYTDGSIDKKPLSEFVNVAPTVELPYSNQEHKQIYVYTGENTDLTFKASDNTAVKDMYVRGPGGIGTDNTANYGFTTGKIENSAVTHGDGTVSGNTATIKMTGVTTLKAPNRWTSFVVANDNDNAPSNTDFNALDKNPNATQTPGYVQFIVKSQTDKYDIATPAPTDKVEVADPTKVTDAELDKIKEKLQLEYNKNNDDANIAKDAPVDKDGKIKSVTKDADGNLVVTYTDGSTDKKPLSEFVTKDTTAPAKPVINTDLTGKAGTKTPVEVSAEPGTKVELFDKDGNKIGEGTADENGKATITPTVEIPAGAVTAKATDPAGNTSVASDPATASTDTEAPAKPVVDTDLTGKAGTKTPVVVSAEPGSKVELFDKDGNKIGEATADENGKATITPTVAIPAGAVTAKATDPAGNTSVASDPATASTDTEAPAKPVVDTDLTGKAGTKTPVVVSAEPGSKVELFDKDGNKIGEATADENGKATITPTVAIPAGAVTAKATDAAGNTSVASDPATASADTEAPAKPVVNTDLTGKAGTKTPVVVSAEPGTKVELFDKDGNKIGEATADENGKATITPTVEIPAGAVTAKATDPAGNTSVASDPATASADTEAPAKPVVNTDLTGKAGTKTPVVVSAEPGSKVELFDKDGNKIGEATADENGKATITPTVAIPAGAVTAKATDAAGNTSVASDPATASADTEAPAKPVVNTDLTGKAGTKTPVVVSAEPGTKVELFDKDGNKIGEATADENGKATITPTVEIPAGAVTAKATDAAGNTSVASDPATASTDTEAPAKPVVDTDLTGKAGTKTPVVVSAEPGSKVELFDKDGNKIGEATADENGKATITPTVAIPAGAVTAKATDAAGNTSVASDPATASTDTEAPAKPVVDTDLTGKAGTKTPVVVSAEPGSKVELFDKDGNKIGEATADENGKATITPTVAIPAGAVTAKATDPAGNTSVASDPATASTDTEAPAKPVVNTDLTGKAGTKTPVEVSAEPGSKVELFDKDGNKIGEGTADENGKATITPTVNIPEGNVTAKATDAAGNTSVASDPATASADTEAPAKPVVNTDLTGKAGTKTPVEVSAEPGSKVELFDKDGNKIGEATADENGKATITPTVEIPAGAVTAKATDAAGNTSVASDPATASADTEAPAKPVVDTDLTGKAGTKTPVVVSAEPGSKVELFDKDGNKIGEATADENGKATITPTVEIPAGAVTAKATDPAGNTSVASDPATASADDKSVKDPAVTPVVDPSNLTDAEKAKVADEVKKANPTASKVEVGNDGTATVTYPDGTSAVIPADKTVKKSDDKSVKDPAVTPVVDPSNLTDAEKAKVADEVKKANPTASKVEVGNDGTATVTYPDGTSAVIPADKTVKKSDDKSVKDPAVTPVVDPSNLTDAEKAKVADEVKKANPSVTDVTVGNDGTATVTYPDGTSAVIPADKTVKKSDDKSVKDPAVTPVVDPSNLTDAEKAKVADEVKKANPSVTDVTVGNDGTATVTYPDGTSAVIPADKTVKKSDDKSVKDPAVTPVVDPSNLTDAEKAKVADEVKKANPSVTDVTVGNDGTATVTYPDGTSAVIPADKTVKKSDDKSVKDPAVTPVVDPSNLTDAEKAKVADEVKKANPSVTDVTVGNDGIATVTYPDGTSAVIPADKTVKKSDDKSVKDPAVTPVVDPSNLTDAEKAKVADEVKKANPSVTDVTVGNDGTATVTYPDGTSAVIPADKTVKKSDDKSVKDPAVTPVVDPSNLTDAEKAKVADEVKKANPSVTDVTVGNDGTATVTYPDGTTAVIPAANTVKKSDDKDPAVTPVVDPSNLTDAEKAKVADEVKKANPTASKVEVGNDGTATVTYPDGTTAVIPADKTVKKSDDKSVKDPAVTPVVDPSNLTDAEKAKVADEVKKANPTASKVEVGNDGTATVTYPDGTTAVIPADKTVKKSDDKSVKDPAVTPVVDPSNLTDAEKAKVADEVKKANPTASKVEVGNDGTATVTYPDGTTAVIPADKTVKKSDDKSVKDPAVTPVVDPSNLTDAEKAKVADEVKKANPSASKVEVGNDGTATVTYPDGTTAVIPADKTVKKSDDKSVKDPAVTPVVDPNNLTDAEKAKVADEVKKANPTASKVEVGNDGTATVTYPDGTSAVIPADKTVKKSDDKSVKDPAVTPVVDPSNLTDAEKAKVADEVKKANPSASKVEVGNDGTATVTYPDGTTAVIPADKTVKKSDDKSVKDPAVTPVVDPNNLTDAEKAKVADEVKKANPSASKVEVGNDGTATVTYPDGTTAVIPADKTVKKSDDKSVKDPAVTPVVDPSNLTDAEKAKVADEVKKANPSASKVEVGNDGTATVTYPDGTTAVIPADKTVKKSDDKSVKAPAVTPVVDPSNLTDAEKAKVADEVKKANPTASKVEVGNDGTATITYPDGTTAILTPKQTITKVSETGNKGNSNSNSDNNSDKTSNTFVKVPAEKTLVKDPSNLTDAERSEIVSKIKQVNPGATVKVDRYGNATVELNGKTVVISSEQLIVSAKETNGQASHQGRVATDSSKKSESGKLPSTGEEQSVASIGLAILSALTGGLLLSKKRKEEE